MPEVAYDTLASGVAGIAHRWPCVGLAVAVVRGGSLVDFAGHGLADIASGTPVTPDTVFRIGSVTKLFTAVAVMQLWERGLVDLDAPANAYLRAVRLVPARFGFRAPTVRQLLTHTAGLREVLRPSGLLRMRDLGETWPAGRAVPTLAEYYDGALRVDADPGTRWMYSNHGFAVLGQLITDVSGQPLDRYFRTHLLDPLELRHTDLIRSDRGLGHRAIGYELRARGAVVVPDYEVVTVGAGGLRSTPRELARFLGALLDGGSFGGALGSALLKPETVAELFAPQYQPDRRLPGMGLAFFRSDLDGHRVVEHDGMLPGFDAQVMLAPDDHVAVLALANGARRGLHWLTPEVHGVLRNLLGAREASIRTDVPQHPERWHELVGWYSLSAHRTDPARFALGAGAEVLVRRGQLMMRFLSPIPALFHPVPLHPDDPDDATVFRVELPALGAGTTRVVFGDGGGLMHLEFAPLSLRKRKPARSTCRVVGRTEGRRCEMGRRVAVRDVNLFVKVVGTAPRSC